MEDNNIEVTSAEDGRELIFNQTPKKLNLNLFPLFCEKM